MDKVRNLSILQPNNYSFHINAPNTSWDHVNCSELTLEFKLAFNTPYIPISTAIIATQVFNLVVFHYWRNKEPFLLLHIWLAVPSLLHGLITTITPITRILPWHEIYSVIAIRLVTFSFYFVQATSTLMLLTISVDRWLSVEFAVRYRNDVSKKILRRVILCNFVAGLLLR